ncbi:MAG: selenide, water dikinase SelD [Chitinophagales bacterium]|nr:selenide, water dikinase SelD [Chitinophagales bacterium]
MQETIVKLTQYSHAAGCGSKIAPAILSQMLESAGGHNLFPNLLVGNETSDDAAIYELENNQCLVSTADFFMPIVDAAYDFGRVAAANALSDVYAMGGKPILALALLGWPIEKLPLNVAKEVLAGGTYICAQAKVPIAGGHTIENPEPFFGYSVTGLVEKKNIKRNNTAQTGDLLFLTKPLGTGILSTALKRNLISAESFQPAIELMCALNNIGEQLGTISEVNAMTDVTGFGLLGHLNEICIGSGLSAEINYEKIKLIEGVKELAKKFVAPDNTFRNWNNYEASAEGIDGERLVTLCDPQTNGGLLVAINEKACNSFIKILKENGMEAFAEPIGVMKEKTDVKIVSVK